MGLHTRREVLRAGVAAAGAAALPPPVWAREDASADAAALLPAPPFYWGIGLERGWIPQSAASAEGRLSLPDANQQAQSFEKWRESIRRAAELGVNCIRCSVPWSRAEPRPGHYDWGWLDAVIEPLVTKQKIIPIIDIMHYGPPAWQQDAVADDRFIDAVTAYSAALASHFRGLVNHYTPLAEPQIIAQLSAGTGRWPPYGRTPDAWSKLGVKLARALVQQSRAIRQEAPEAVLISAECFVFENFARTALTANAAAQPSEQVLNDVALFPSCLAYGRIDPAHPLAWFLVQQGVSAEDIEWFQRHYATPDIHGVDFHPEIELAELGGDFAKAEGMRLEQAARRAAQHTEQRCRLAYRQYKAPIYLTETSAGLTAEKRNAYLEALHESVLALRADGIPIRGLNWWPLSDPAAGDAYRAIIRRDTGERGPVLASERKPPTASPEAAAILAARAAAWVPSDAPNTPFGTAQGIHPGRVTWARDARVARWNGVTGRWWDEGNIDQQIFDTMLARSLDALTGEADNSRAWEALFRHYNARHGRGERGWQAGELIAIKINLNNTSRPTDADNGIDQSTQGLRALLAQLVGQAKVDPACIAVYDAKRAVPDRIFQPLHAEFPGVRWVGAAEAPGREMPDWVENAITYTSPEVQLGNSLPRVCVEAAYLINVALLKGHEMAGVTLCAKNHFGSIMYPQRDHSRYVTPYRHDITAWSGFVDLMGSPNLGGKTMLYVLDGIYGTQTNVQGVGDRDRWRRLFNGEWSASLFLSQDPVAIDSVGLDFLRSEFQANLGYSGARAFARGAVVNCDNYLHEAALGRNARLGPYRPNGRAIGSLGVHEHWNDPVDKQYSRNLDPEKGKGIELVRVG